MGNMFGGQGLTPKKKGPTVLMGYLVDNAPQGSLPDTVRHQSGVYTVLRDFKGYVAQGCVVPIGLGNIFGNKDMIHSNYFFKGMELPPIGISPKSKTHP